MLTDTQQRTIRYLRLSITDGCNMNCLYCRPGSKHGGADQQLTKEEIHRLINHLVIKHGVNKVRLTGGEPTSRKDHLDIINTVARIPGLSELVMTTNGLTLAQNASAYAEGGLHRINVSLDSLNPERFAQLTGIDGLAKVLAGLEAAEKANLRPIRLNTVVVKGINDRDLPDLMIFAADSGYEIRFIELMPMGPLADQWEKRFVSESQMRRILEPYVQEWKPLTQGNDAARRYQAILCGGRVAVVGFITPMSCLFCAACNRIRVTTNGTLYPCLMDEPGPNLLQALRPKFLPWKLDQLLGMGLEHKRTEHPLKGPTAMIQLGG